MSDRPDELRKDRLIELLQTTTGDSIPKEWLADLSDEERAEFYEAREALRLLEAAGPATRGDSRPGQQAIDTAELHQGATPGSWPSKAVSGLDAADRLPGIETLGHYEILETLGQGGFGIVVKARDTKLGRIVALKIPRVDSFSQQDETRQRFAREARLVAMLSHPAIVPIYETGSDGPLLYIASAWCSGGTLSSWFSAQGKSIAPTLAARIVARLAEAVQHAHSRGVIHRDLKPGNVLLEKMVEQPDQDPLLVDSLRITDFGLARWLADDQSVTRTGAAIGTPAYMSPEQARGDTGEIGPATDIYALGAMLYELLTGEPPIVGPSNIATMRAIEREVPLPPRQRNRAVPADLDAICLKCLEKNRADRYDSAQRLEDDLQRFLRGEPVTARPAGPLTRLNRWGRRNPLVAGAVSIAFVSLTVGLALSIAFGIRAHRSMKLASEKQALAEEKSAEALTQAKLARGAVDRLQRAIASEPKLFSEGMEKFKLNLAAAARDYYQLVSTQQPDDPDVLREYIDTLKGLAYLQQLVGNHEDAAVIWDQAADITREAFPDELLKWAGLRSKLAEDKLITGKTQEAVDITRELVDRLEQRAMETGSEAVLKNLVFQLINAAQNLNHQGNPDQAEPLVDQAIELVDLLSGHEPEGWPANRTWARVLRCKSETAIQLANHDDIDHFAPLAIGLYERIMADDPARTSEALDSMASMHQNLGTSKRQRGLFDQAITEFEKEKELMMQLMERHPDVAGLSFNWSNHIHRYSQALFEAGRVQAADRKMTPHLIWLMQKQEQYPQLLRLLRITEVECRELMSRIDERLGRTEAAAEELESAVAVCEQECQSEQAPRGLRAFLANLYTIQAERLLDDGRIDSSRDLVNRAIEILEPLATENQAADPAQYLENARRLLEKIDGCPAAAIRPHPVACKYFCVS